MTLSQALFVKWLRIRQEGSWRWVAIEYHKRYRSFPFASHPFDDDKIYGLQQNGIKLCYEAMKSLNEKIEDGWN